MPTYPQYSKLSAISSVGLVAVRNEASTRCYLLPPGVKKQLQNRRWQCLKIDWLGSVQIDYLTRLWQNICNIPRTLSDEDHQRQRVEMARNILACYAEGGEEFLESIVSGDKQYWFQESLTLFCIASKKITGHFHPLSSVILSLRILGTHLAHILWYCKCSVIILLIAVSLTDIRDQFANIPTRRSSSITLYTFAIAPGVSNECKLHRGQLPKPHYSSQTVRDL